VAEWSLSKIAKEVGLTKARVAAMINEAGDRD
jgi:hypothetical protein